MLNVCRATANVPDIEWYIRTVTDRTHSTYCLLPFRHIQWIMHVKLEREIAELLVRADATYDQFLTQTTCTSFCPGIPLEAVAAFFDNFQGIPDSFQELDPELLCFPGISIVYDCNYPLSLFCYMWYAPRECRLIL